MPAVQIRTAGNRRSSSSRSLGRPCFRSLSRCRRPRAQVLMAAVPLRLTIILGILKAFLLHRLLPAVEHDDTHQGKCA